MASLKFLKLYQPNCLTMNFSNILGSKHRLTFNYILSTFINLNEWCKMCRNLSTLSLRGLKTVRSFLSLVLEQMTVYLPKLPFVCPKKVQKLRKRLVGWLQSKMLHHRVITFKLYLYRMRKKQLFICIYVHIYYICCDLLL